MGGVSNYVLIEVVLVGVGALGFGGYQLWSVNREIARDKAKAAEEAGREP